MIQTAIVVIDGPESCHLKILEILYDSSLHFAVPRLIIVNIPDRHRA